MYKRRSRDISIEWRYHVLSLFSLCFSEPEIVVKNYQMRRMRQVEKKIAALDKTLVEEDEKQEKDGEWVRKVLGGKNELQGREGEGGGEGVGRGVGEVR